MQLVEYFQALEIAGGNVTSFFSATYDTDELIFAGNFLVPVNLVTPGFSFVGNTAIFLATTTFVAGTGGTITSPLALDYFLEVLARLISLQNTPTQNPQNSQNITATINPNKLQAFGNFSLPFTKAVTPTGLTITPTAYLL
jgi:hypothetical protein